MVEGESFLDIVHKALEVAEGCVAFVTVIYLFLDAKFLQQQRTAYTEKYLLLETVFPVTTVECVCDRTVKLGVHVVVSVKEVEFYTAYVSLPNECVNHIVHVGYVYNDLITVLVKGACYGE